MKKLLLVAVVYLSVVAGLFAQIKNPVKWNYTIRKVGDKTYELHAVALIENGWHIYSQLQPPKEIIKVQKTTLELKTNPLVMVNEKPSENGKRLVYKDETIGVTTYLYKNKLEIVQTLTLKAKVNTNVDGSVTYQACTDSECLPPKEEAFSLKIE